MRIHLKKLLAVGIAVVASIAAAAIYMTNEQASETTNMADFFI